VRSVDVCHTAGLDQKPVSFPDLAAFNLTESDLLDYLDQKQLISVRTSPIIPITLGNEKEANMKAAIYMRVSTTNHGQTVETQRLALMDFAQKRGFEVADENIYSDEGVSGSKDRRPALDRLMRDAKARKFDVVVVSRFDRFARSSRHLLNALGEFAALGIDFVSLNEALDTSTPMGKMVFTIMSALAEFERDLIRERVHMGLDRARRQKKTLGRPKRIFDRMKVVELQAEGKSLRQIASILRVGKGTVQRALVIAGGN